MKKTTYGQRGGQGPNQGKTAHTYTVTLSDGRILQKRTFTNFGPRATAVMDRWDDKEFINQIIPHDAPEPRCRRGEYFLVARRAAK